jgi:hypothetical protein
MERRMTKRSDINCFLEYDHGATTGNSGVKIYKAKAQNICTNGLRIATSHPLEKGMVIRLGIPEKGPKMAIPAFAEVAWAVPDRNRFQAGLRFLKFVF